MRVALFVVVIGTAGFSGTSANSVDAPIKACVRTWIRLTSIYWHVCQVPSPCFNAEEVRLSSDIVEERGMSGGKKILGFKTGDVGGIREPGQHYGKTGRVCEFFGPPPGSYTIELADGKRVKFPFGDLRKVENSEEA